jgi:hypothetical protein
MTGDSQQNESETETEDMDSEGDRNCLILLYCIIWHINIYVITVN